MHTSRINLKRITAVALIIVGLFAIAAITINSTYVGRIQTLVRNTTKTSVMELTVARARYLDECIGSDLNSVQSLATYLSHANYSEATTLAEDFLETHEATVAWMRSTTGEEWCSLGDETTYPTDQEESLFQPALQGYSGVSEMYFNTRDEKRLLISAPILKADVHLEEDETPTADQIIGAVYAAYPADELQNAYGTPYTDTGETFVISSDGTIVLDANHSADDAVDGNIADILSQAANSTEDVDLLLRGIQEGSEGSLTLVMDGEQQFVYFTPLSSRDGWSLVSILPLSVIEGDGAAIIDITSQMVAVLAIAVTLSAIALIALLVRLQRRRSENTAYLKTIYQAIGANIDTAIIIIDRVDHTIEVVFDNIRAIMGIPASKFFHLDPLSPNEAYAKVAAILKSRVPEERCTWEFQCYNKALKRSMWLRITSHIVELGGREKIIFTLADVTKDHTIRQQLIDSAEAAEEANRAKSKFLSSMSHDIRTPMNAILGFSSMIEHDADNPTAVRAYNRKIASSGEHLLGLINDVLDMSKIEAGKTTLNAARFSIQDTIDSVDSMIRSQTDEKDQTFTVIAENIEHPVLIGDEGRLRQILMNVLSNAMKYTPRRGEISLTVEGSPSHHSHYQHLHIVVADNGIGMSPEYLATMFDSFTREISVHVSKIEGTGLGMAITKNLVDLMGGMIAVESEQGLGTTFTIDLDFPVAPDDAEIAPTSVKDTAEVAHALDGKHFLVAEDNELNAEIITAILGMHDATCEIAENGEIAVQKFAESAPGTYDMIFMDVQMPTMDGLEATRTIRALDREDASTIPIVAMTANAFAEDEQENLAAGMNAHISKPINVKTLETTVAQLL